jgi:hypothetical protein
MGLPLGATPGGHTRKVLGAKGPYFTGLSRSHFKVAERKGFEPLLVLAALACLPRPAGHLANAARSKQQNQMAATLR